MLVIADEKKPLGLAGVMGGEHSGIGATTTDVLLEVAFFLPDAVAGRGRRYGIVTDASQRFERGVDPTLQERAIERATQLLCAAAGGNPGPTQLTQLTAELPQQPIVRLRPERARRVIGADIGDAAIEEILRSLGMSLTRDAAGWDAVAPPWRFDIAIEEDLIEEVARVYGFERIPETVQPARQPLAPCTETRVGIDTITDLLVQRGYHEAITYSFIEPELQKLFVPDAATLELTNPISTDLASMRASLWPGLVTALAANQRRQQSRVRLFEVGRKFVIDPAGALREVAVVAGIAAGPALPEQWGAAKAAVDFHDVKADVEALSRATGANAEFRFEAQSHPALHPGQTARIVRDGLATGWIGRLHPSIESKLDLTYSALVFELELETAFAARVPQFADVSRFPAVRRDLAVVVAEPVTVQELLDRIRSAAGCTAARRRRVRHISRRGHRNRSQECGDRLEFTGRFPHAY